MEYKECIHFVLNVNVEGMYISSSLPQGIEFIPEGGGGLRFVLQPINPDLDKTGHCDGLICKAYKTYPATTDQVLFVDSYNNHNVMTRVAEEVSLPFIVHDKVLISEDGACAQDFSPRRYLCPPDIKNLIERVESELASKTDRFLKLLRWRQRVDAPSDGYTHHTLYWKVGEGKPHFLAPLDGSPSQQITLPSLRGIRWSEAESSDLQELWASQNLTEPLGHTLLREAAALASESPRSSILIMTAALETAVKMHISRIAPDTAWLMEEVPSPPISKVLRDYIPLIHRDRGNELCFWDKVKPSINKVQKLIELRNKVSHTGKIPEGTGSINDYIELLADFLYLLDVLDGHEWAKSFVSSKLCNTLGWPTPKFHRITTTITMDY